MNQSISRTAFPPFAKRLIKLITNPIIISTTHSLSLPFRITGHRSFFSIGHLSRNRAQNIEFLSILLLLPFSFFSSPYLVFSASHRRARNSLHMFRTDNVMQCTLLFVGEFHASQIVSQWLTEVSEWQTRSPNSHSVCVPNISFSHHSNSKQTNNDFDGGDNDNKQQFQFQSNVVDIHTINYQPRQRTSLFLNKTLYGSCPQLWGEITFPHFQSSSSPNHVIDRISPQFLMPL